jgi:hypothetical protein
LKTRRIFTGPDLHSHYAQFTWQIHDERPDRNILSAVPAESVLIHDVFETSETARHTAPQVQLVFVIRGSVEIRCSVDEVETFGPGDIFLAADTYGEGHITRALECPLRMLVARLPDHSAFAE